MYRNVYRELLVVFFFKKKPGMKRIYLVVFKLIKLKL
jgi:hypothetical protein